MAGVILKKVRKAFGKTVAVYDIDLQIEDGNSLFWWVLPGAGRARPCGWLPVLRM